MSDITKATLGRLPSYLSYLNSLPDSVTYVSSSKISAALGYGEVQVKKDLSSVSAVGRPKIGYKKSELICDIKKVITHRDAKVVLVGVGKLGKALLEYDGFNKFGFSICAAFDSDAAKVGKSDNGKVILPFDELESYCRENGVQTGIITVPQKHAQSVCDALVGSGVKAIWNFAPIRLSVPDDVLIKNEDLSLSLAYLNLALADCSED